MTNKTMLSVERDLLERVVDNRYREKERISIARHEALWELRALLDKPAAQHQGEPVSKAKPVAKLHAERLTGKDGEYGITVEDSEWFNTCRLNGGIFNLYAEQPAPVAVAKLMQAVHDVAGFPGVTGYQLRELADRLNGLKP